MKITECTVSIVAPRSEWMAIEPDAPQWFRDRIWSRKSIEPRGETGDPEWRFTFRAATVEKVQRQIEWATGQTFWEPDLMEQLRRTREKIEAL